MAEKDVNNEIYKILARGKPSEEKVAKNPELKADWDKAQQLIKDNWKDGVPDEFMAKAFPKYESAVALGGYGPERAKKLANIVDGLKEFDENNPDDKMLDKFINADNTPNGNTPATYIAHHAVAAQEKMAAMETDDDKTKMQSLLKAQQETLQMLADNGADFSKTDNNHQSVEEVAQIGQPKGKYSPAIDKFIAKASADGEKYQDSVVVKEKQKALNVKEQGQTNIGNTQALAPNEQQKQQPQPELEGDVKPEDQEHGSGSEDYKGPAIKEKDIIDYLYNDVFIYYLNMLADKIIGYVKGKADRFAEYTRAESAKAQKSKSNLRSQQCNVARQKCVGLFQQTAPQLTAEMEQAQLGRAKKLKMLNSELRENIVHRRPIAQWAFPSMQQRQQQMQQQMQQMGADASDEQRTAEQARYAAEVEADRHITDHFKQLYTQDPENCMRQLELAEKNLDKYLELDNAFGKMAIQRVMIKKANGYMDKSGFEWVNDKDLNMNDPKARAKLIKAAEAEKQEMWQRYALVTQLGLDRAKLENLNETQTAQTVAQYQENFMDLEVKMAQKAFDMTLDDVSHDRFNAAAKIVDEKTRGMDKKEAKEYKAKFVRTAKDIVKSMDFYQTSADDLASKMEIKTADGQTTDLKTEVGKRKEIDASQKTFMEDYQRGLSVMQAAQEQNNDRKAEIGKFKKGLLIPSATNHMFAEVYTPKKGGGRNG